MSVSLFGGTWSWLYKVSWVRGREDSGWENKDAREQEEDADLWSMEAALSAPEEPPLLVLPGRENATEA